MTTTMVETENITIADYIVLYIFPSHATTLLRHCPLSILFSFFIRKHALKDNFL